MQSQIKVLMVQQSDDVGVIMFFWVVTNFKDVILTRWWSGDFPPRWKVATWIVNVLPAPDRGRLNILECHGKVQIVKLMY